MESPIRRVLEALTSHGCEPRQVGPGRWQALCPIHELDGQKHSPSLSVAQGDDGRALLKADPAQVVFVAEGEKCCEALGNIALLAVTSAGGSNAAEKTDWSPLAGRHVVILPHNDQEGREYAKDAARLCHQAKAASVRIIDLAKHWPDCPDKGDVADLLAAAEGAPWGEAAEPADIAAWFLRLAEATPAWTPEGEPWPNIIPLDALELPDFPTHVLPDDLRRWVEEESHATQTPPELAALLALAGCSATIARRVIVEPRPGWREPVNLYVATLLESGNRKSAVFADATGPLREIEVERIAGARPEVARRQSERRQAELRLRKLEKRAAERNDLEAGHEAASLAEELAEQPEPVLPRLLVDDATAEKLGMMLAEQGGRIASMSAEGGVFDLMAGLYSKSGLTQFDVYLKGHSGDDLITDRVGRKPVYVKRPAITCAYAIQPAVIAGLAQKPAFRGRGLLARFLYAAPASWIGRREIAPRPVSEHTYAAYRQTIRRLAEVEGEHVLRLDAEASAALVDWEAEIEADLADGGTMETTRDWGGEAGG